MKATRNRRYQPRLATTLCAMVVALSIVGCGTTGRHDSYQASAPTEASRSEPDSSEASRAVGTAATAVVRGVAGTALGALGGVLYSLRCGILAPICAPILAVGFGAHMGIKAVASTPGLRSTHDAREVSSNTTVTPPAEESAKGPDTVEQPDAAARDQTIAVQTGAEPGPHAVPTAPEGTLQIDPTTDASNAVTDPMPAPNAQPVATESVPTTPAASPEPLQTASVVESAQIPRQGDHWEYAYARSSDGRSGTRSFEVLRRSGHVLTETIVLEDGTTTLAEHQRGAYLDMTAGMQFAPYYFALGNQAAEGKLDGIRVVGGEACVDRGDYAYGAILSCNVLVEFGGIESVTVPAGTFDAKVVRITVSQERISGYGGRVGVLGTATYWFAPKAGRLVKAIVKHDAERPWTETMELVSYQAGGPA